MKDSPYYRTGTCICASFMLFNGFLAFGLGTLLAWENKRLDRKYGVVGRVQGDGTMGDGKSPEIGDGDENDGPRFRHVL